MKCPKCSCETPEKSRFCQNCGFNIQKGKIIRVCMIVFGISVLLLILLFRFLCPSVDVSIGV